MDGSAECVGVEGEAVWFGLLGVEDAEGGSGCASDVVEGKVGRGVCAEDRAREWGERLVEGRRRASYVKESLDGNTNQ